VAETQVHKTWTLRLYLTLGEASNELHDEKENLFTSLKCKDSSSLKKTSPLPAPPHTDLKMVTKKRKEKKNYG